MTSRSPWHIEAIQQRSETDEEIDWYQGNPGPAMRGSISKWFKPGVGPCTTVWLRVTYLATGHVRRVKVIKDGRRYLALYGGEDLTLEAATKKMKEELRG